MAFVLAVEDILRMIIITIHNWVSALCHALAMIPMCLVFFITKTCCFPSSSSYRAGCYPMGTNSCGCVLFFIMILVFILVYFYTNYIEDFFATFDIQFPNLFWKHKKNDKLQEANEEIVSKPKNVESGRRRVRGFQDFVHNEETINHSTESVKHVKQSHRDIRREIKNDLDVPYIDNFKENYKKENFNKSRLDKTNLTYVTVVVDAIVEESDEDDESSKK